MITVSAISCKYEFHEVFYDYAACQPGVMLADIRTNLRPDIRYRVFASQVSSLPMRLSGLIPSLEIHSVVPV